MDQASLVAPKLERAKPFAELMTADVCDTFFENDFGRNVRCFLKSAFEPANFDLRTFFKILTTTAWPTGDLTIVPGLGKASDPNFAARILGNRNQLTLDNLKALRASKATIGVKQIDRVHNGLRELCFKMAESGFYQSRANAYYTPAGSQGYKAHWDMHDVFVLQMAGTKTWHVGKEPEIIAPLEITEHKIPSDYRIEDERIIEVSEGQLLYVPAGFGHYAVTDATDSLHITIGIKPIAWADLFTKTAYLAPIEDAALRGNLTELDAMESGDLTALANEAKKRMIKSIEQFDVEGLIKKKLSERSHNAHLMRGEMFGKDIDALLK